MRPLALAVVLLAACLAGTARGASRAASSGRQTPAVIREWDVVAERWEFTPNRIEANQGDHLKVTVRSADGTHGFEIKALHVHAKVPRAGEPVTVEFVASRAGTFEIACSEYCGTGHHRMKAVLVVNPTTEAGTDVQR
jgi:cytochrome c oxidase subunit 2